MGSSLHWQLVEVVLEPELVPELSDGSLKSHHHTTLDTALVDVVGIPADGIWFCGMKCHQGLRQCRSDVGALW